MSTRLASNTRQRIALAKTIIKRHMGEQKMVEYLRFLKQQDFELEAVCYCHLTVLSAISDIANDAPQLSETFVNNELFEIIREELKSIMALPLAYKWVGSCHTLCKRS